MQTSTLTSPGKLKNNQNVISTQTILFCGPLIMNKTAPCVEKARGHRSNQANKQPTVKASG